MKDERRIIIKNEQLKKIRNNLRKILIKAVWDEIEILRYYANLYGLPLDLPPEEEIKLYYLEGTKHKLFLKNKKNNAFFAIFILFYL